MADYIYYVTVSGSTFLIDGEPQAELGLKAGLTYRFDVSDASCASQTFKFSTTSDGTHGGGSEYTTNVTVTGTAGSSGAVVDLIVPSSTGTLYYYNGAASGYGGTILHTTGTYVSTANLGLRIPLPGASDDVWASHLNASLRTLDSGVIKAVAGAEATPSIANTSDTNTGIYFPAADTVGVSTGGTERVRIDSSGNVQLANSLTAGTLGSGVVFPAGHVLQIQSSTLTAGETTSSTTVFESIDGTDQNGSGTVWCVKITPIFSTSKIFITVNCGVVGGSSNVQRVYFGLFRDSTQIALGDAGTGEEVLMAWTPRSGDAYQMTNMSNSFLDSPTIPSTPVEITYALYWKAPGHTGTINRPSTVDANAGNSISTITAFELAQ